METLPLPESNSECVGSLVSNRWAVRDSVTIGTLAEEWKHHLDVSAVGVVGASGQLAGMLSASRLYSLLGRQYGWDIFQRKRVAEIVDPIPTLRDDDPLLLISERLGSGAAESGHYAVVDDRGMLRGLFSQGDLIQYFSQATLRDLETAQRLQTQLVRTDAGFREGGIVARGVCQMFRGVGGDLWMLRQFSPGRWFGCVCDVSGKGVAASLVTTLIWGVLETADLTAPLTNVVASINAAVFHAFESEKFVSGFFWSYADGAVTYADMGHSHQILYKDGELVPFADSVNLPMGIDERVDVVLGTLELGPGDGILAYSDGVVENLWGTGNDFPLPDVLNRVLASRGTEVIAGIQKELAEFRRIFPAHDDVSMVWFQRA